MSISKICRCMLYTVGGWKKNITETHPQKCIICLAPHTSNWDFIIGQLYSYAEGMKFNFLMKKEWFFWPLGSIFKKMGGIPVYRDKASSMTNRLAEIAKKNDYFRLVITPEGTRSPRKEWKRGFYYIAQEARIPIMLYGAKAPNMFGRFCCLCMHSILKKRILFRRDRLTKAQSGARKTT
ncbi:MAG: 1-acyl-sn-glycerol-3-phosphate acyltransferase, partial [Prevotella sp.]|nr:1-acyl-sn-glycerol-3-phosphate acyltransferase [Prevotella sp.]